MAHNLLTLSLLLDRDDWGKIARQQLQNMLDGMEHYGSGYSNWALLLQRFLRPRYTVKIYGNASESTKQELFQLISPQVVLHYEPAGENGFVVCGDGMCWPKVDTVSEVYLNIKN